jgi:hypothetical protein
MILGKNSPENVTEIAIIPPSKDIFMLSILNI